MKIYTLLLCIFFCLSLSYLTAQTPCSGGVAGTYPCNSIDLQSFISRATLEAGNAVNDIWGWTDPLDNKEYALLGLSSGTAFVDISNPTNPIFLGRLPTHTSNSSWRDIKVIGNYAYIVSEASGHGMQVFDLTRLRTVPSPPTTFTEDGHINYGNGRSHNVVALEETGYIIAVGTSGYNSGGMTFFDVNSTPLNPQLIGAFTSDGYTHDAVCFVYRGPDKNYIGREICIGFNEDTNTIIDATDKTNLVQLSKTPYTGSRYTHQGWVTDDHRYILVNDELDESNNGHNTRTYIFDIADLNNPVFMGYHEHATAAIDHNLYIKGRYVYESNYRAGLRVLDIGDIANTNLSEIASFDTYPSSNSAEFNGTWSNYPYFKSGNIVVSGIGEGLFVVKPNFPHFNFDLQTDGVVELCPGSSANITLDLDAYAGFSDNINLSLSGLDPALTATLSSTTIPVGGQVTVTITAASGDDPVCPGNFCVLLTGVGNTASSQQSIALGIVVDNTLAGCTTACLGCADGIMNGDETGIDCGGPDCPVCSSCTDGIMNGDETGIDCGGPDCPVCSSCTDGIMNGDETGIDCGGPDCPVCPDNCISTIYINCNGNSSGNTANSINQYQNYIGAASGYTAPELVYEFTLAFDGIFVANLTNTSVNFDMFLYGDCDPTGTILAEGRTGPSTSETLSAPLVAGTYYLFIDARKSFTGTFDLSITCPQGNCSDAVQNEDETGVDCGGVNCPSCPIFVAPKVFLQGPFDGANMNIDLMSTGVLPTTEPYTTLGYMHVGGGGETTSANVVGASDMVDWVIVELRDKNNPATILSTRSALLKQDGTVVSHTDGSSAVSFQAAADNYYVAIRHRNHLAVMTNSTVWVD